jgi:hypothetical protein
MNIIELEERVKKLESSIELEQRVNQIENYHKKKEFVKSTSKAINILVTGLFIIFIVLPFIYALVQIVLNPNLLICYK